MEREQFLKGLVAVMDDESCTILRRLIDDRLNSPGEDMLTAYEREQCKKGNKIEAIRSVRTRIGCDLRMAKDIVDRVCPPRVG